MAEDTSFLGEVLDGTGDLYDDSWLESGVEALSSGVDSALDGLGMGDLFGGDDSASGSFDLFGETESALDAAGIGSKNTYTFDVSGLSGIEDDSGGSWWDDTMDFFSNEKDMTGYGNLAKGLGGLTAAIYGVYDGNKQNEYKKEALQAQKEQQEWENELAQEKFEYEKGMVDKEYEYKYDALDARYGGGSTTFGWGKGILNTK